MNIESTVRAILIVLAAGLFSGSAGAAQPASLIDRGGRLSPIHLSRVSSLAAVPRPGVLALLGIGMLLAGLARTRKVS
jgi:hypothetical protein